MKLALVQMSISDSMDQNLKKTLHSIDEAAAKGAKAICFPELQLSPFFPQYPGKKVSKYALPIDSEIVQQIQKKCCEHQMIGFPNFYLEENNKCYDASPVFDSNGMLLGVSKMVHIAQAEFFYEQDYYTQSDSGFHVYETSFGNIGVVICFDRHFPESIRTCAMKGAKLIIIPTANTKAEPTQLFEWEVRVAAMQNGVFIAMCNRVGLEGEMDFCGESIVVDPNGDVFVKADDKEQIVYADLNLDDSTKTQENRPYLPLRRPETYL